MANRMVSFDNGLELVTELSVLEMDLDVVLGKIDDCLENGDREYFVELCNKRAAIVLRIEYLAKYLGYV